MRIALDFDGTFTLDPGFWYSFVRKAQTIGHQVWIVTARDEINDGIAWRKVMADARPPLPPCPCEIIFCDGRTKRKVTRELGIEIDVWIDDNPAGIILPSSFKDRESLAAWRATDEYRGSTLPIHGESRGFEEKENVAANRPEGAKVAANLHGRPGLFSARPRGDRGGLPQGERPAQSGATLALGSGEVNGPR